MKELYINNKLVELDSQTRLDLQFKSFLFSGISELTAPRSWTVSLPKSASNLALIDGASAGDSDSAFPYDNYVVDYYSKGYRVINQGKGILIKITDRIEFTFRFGKAYEAIKLMSEKKLVEITETTDDWLTWNRLLDFNDMTDGIGWCDWYNFTNEDRSYTSNLDVPFAVTHPTVNFDWLINRIGTEFSLDLSQLSGQDKMNVFAFPLKNSNGISSGLNIGLSYVVDSIDTSKIYLLETGRYNQILDVSPVAGIFYLSRVKPDVKETITINFHTSIYVTPEASVGVLRLYKNGVQVATTIDSEVSALYEFYELIHSETFVAGDEFWFEINKSTIYPSETSTLDNTMDISMAYYGGYFPIIPNLPDMTCADFLFQAMQLSGVFPSVSDDTPTVIDFFSADVLYDNLDLGLAKDWSNKLVKTNPRMNELSDAEFKFGSYAQRNTLAYKTDETNLLNTSSFLTVANTNLELENKLVELKFAAGKRFSVSDITIDYPLYDIKIQSGVLIKNARTQSNDVIAEIVNVSGVNYLKFTDNLLWSSLKTANYSGYQSLIQSPRYLREKFYLKPEDIAAIKLEIPIYLSQFGKYYAVMIEQYKEDEISECELLEIKNI